MVQRSSLVNNVGKVVGLRVGRRRNGLAVRFLRGDPADAAPQQPFPADWGAASAGSERSGRQRLKLVVGRLCDM
jgi:hypothetical protein